MESAIVCFHDVT